MSQPNKLSQKDVHLVSDLHAAMQEEKHPGMFSVLMILFAFLLTLLIWSYNSVVEEVTRGQGSIIPSSREQVIQSLDPGILSEMLVKEGDLVEKDQVLLRLDNTRSTAILRESQARLHNLLAIAARLTAEAYDKPLVFSDDIPKDVQDRERLVYQTRLNALKDSVDGLENNKMYLDKEIKMTKPLVSKGAISEVELLRMQRQSGELALQILERKNRYTAEANNELVRIESDISQLRETVKRLEDPVTHAELKAPLKGVVKNIRINTIGGVISAGQDIMEIVPVGETLLVEAYITPRDVAYVTPGMKAVVKLTAYDYALYGGLDGEVTLLSPGALHAMKRPSDLNLNPNEAFYRVIVRTNSDSKMTDKNGKVLPIIPGMIASVDIKTGQKTIFQYLIKPITRMKQALSER
ncbi:MAG: HlyD family efflux transporter periplasmic adaptor subunit [Alcaligenaceae bacterium]|nr:HlyD family efflux transporter periplasmic adaptor subunit [Alcaligenaceae bacterium]